MTLTIAIVVATLALLRCFALERRVRWQARRIVKMQKISRTRQQ